VRLERIVIATFLGGFTVAAGFLLGSLPSPRAVGGASGLLDTGATFTEPREPSVSPSGRRVPRGTLDSLGYVLPLDVRRPRPETPRPPRPIAPLSSRHASVSEFEEQRLSAADGHTQNETVVDVDGDTLIAGWNNYTETSLVMGVSRSTDGGATWTSGLIAGHDAMSDPVVKAGGNGTWYYAYIARGAPWGSDFDVFVRRSTNAGASWQSPVPVTSNGTFDDKPFMDAAGNEVLVGYADFAFSPSKLRVARSLDGGLSFGANTILSVNSIVGNLACPVIDASGDYHMFWRDSWQESLWISTSLDQGAHWSPDRGIVAMHPLPSTLPGGFRIINAPSADADPVTGDLVVVWNDQLFGNPDILAIRSTDGGDTWSAPVRVNDDAGAAAQWFPWIAFDLAGVLHAVWYDRRIDGTSIDVFYARSVDGGASFEVNVRVTARGFTYVAPWENAPNFMGDYNGIAANAAYAFPFYQDSREGYQDVYMSRIPNGAVGVGTSPPVAATGLRASPTPFRSSTILEAWGAEPAASIDIVDVGGRLVRSLALRGGSSVAWDGRDGDGRSLPGGVYFARLRGRESAAARVVKLE